MARRTTVTPEEVFQVAESLAAAGRRPTTLLIREQVGGSFTTVGKYLEQWEQQHPAPVPVVMEVPPEVVSRANEAIQTLWRAATDLANREIAQIRAAAAEDRTAAQAKYGEQATIVEQLEGQIETQEQTIEEYGQEVTRLQREVAEARMAAEVATARVADREQVVVEHEQTIARLRDELAQARATAERETQRASDLRVQLDGLELEGLEQRIVQVEHAKLLGELAALRERLDEQARIIDRLTPLKRPVR
jgi:chromosome segregation ATPase